MHRRTSQATLGRQLALLCHIAGLSRLSYSGETIMKYTHVPELNRLCIGVHCCRLWDVTCPSVPVRGRCV